MRQQSSRAFVEGVKRGLVNAAWGVREWLSPPDAAGAGRRDDGVDGRGPMPHHEVGREDVDADRVPVRGEHDEESARAEAGGERAERPQETQAVSTSQRPRRLLSASALWQAACRCVYCVFCRDHEGQTRPVGRRGVRPAQLPSGTRCAGPCQAPRCSSSPSWRDIGEGGTGGRTW